MSGRLVPTWKKVFASGAVGPSPLLTNLVSYWAMEEAAGATKLDSVVATANDLSDSNTVAQTTGRVANCGNYTAASNQALTHVSNASLTCGDIDFTFCAWVQIHTKGANRTVLGKWNAANPDMDYLLRYEHPGDRFKFWGANGTTSYYTITANTFGSPSIDTWYLIFCWRDAALNKIYIQVNETEPDSDNAASAATNAYDFQIGRSKTAVNNWEGKIDEVGFWKRKLDWSERVMLYNNGNGITYPLALPLALDALTFEGDSLTAGFGGATPYPDQIITSLYPAPTTSVRWYNVAAAGANASAIVSQGAQADDHYGTLFEKNAVVYWAGTNDLLTTADTAVTVYGNIQTYVQARQAVGFKVAVLTLTPTNYALKPPDYDARRATLNGLILANGCGADAVIDVGNSPTLADPNDTTYYNADKLHLKTAGNTVVAGMVAAVIPSL